MENLDITHGIPVYDDDDNEVLDENGDPVFELDEDSDYEYFFDGETEVYGWELSCYIWEFVETPAPGEPPMKCVSVDLDVARYN